MDSRLHLKVCETSANKNWTSKTVSGLKPKTDIFVCSAMNGGVTEMVVRLRTVVKKEVALKMSNF